LGSSQLLILGGDDGAQAKLLQQSHTGFRRDILAYDTAGDNWTTIGELPFSLVATPSVRWRNRIIIPGGEERPGIRSNKVWEAEITPE
jgi:N-acetylneuraminic acid mutarotase